MRTLTTIVLLMIAHSIVAQKSFEGKITYQITGSRQKITALADVYFKPGRIRAALRTAANTTKSKDDLLILLDSGMVYHLNLAKGTYSKDDLREPFALSAPAFVNNPLLNTSVLGFHCNAASIDKTAGNRFMGGAVITVWPADSLLFPGNKKFATGEMSVAFIDGTHINLAAQFIFNTPGGQDTASLNAVMIQPGILEDSFFLLPAGMSAASNIPDQDAGAAIEADATSMTAAAAVDSVARIADSIVRLVSEKAAAIQGKTQKSSLKTPTPKTASKNTHKQPTKSPATKPKE